MSAPAQPLGQRRSTSSRIPKLIGWAALAILVIAMILNTKFLTADEAAELVPQPFDAVAFVDENWDTTVSTLQTEGTDINTLAAAVAADPAAACQEYGAAGGSAGSCAFPVTAVGTVESADDRFITVNVADLPGGATVRIPVGTTLNGTPVRDAAGYKFSDFPGQTQYQQVSNEFKARMQADVVGTLDVAALTGQQVSIVGAYSIPGPSTSYIIQPVEITEGGAS
ncbi:MAG: DUF2291 family protein [Actinomycetales bacterium]